MKSSKRHFHTAWMKLISGKSKWKNIMQVRKSLKIPIHYATTKSKISKLDNLTARITYCITRISELITDETKIDRPTIRKLVKDNNIALKTGLSAGFIDQCNDKVIWAWNSYRRIHGEWEKKLKKAQEKVRSARDEKEKEKWEKSLQRLLKREPSRPSFQDKTTCRIDYRTGKVERGEVNSHHSGYICQHLKNAGR